MRNVEASGGVSLREVDNDTQLWNNSALVSTSVQVLVRLSTFETLRTVKIICELHTIAGVEPWRFTEEESHLRMRRC